MKKLLAGLVCFLAFGILVAQANTTAGTSASVAWGQTLLTRVRGTPASQFWFLSSVTRDRSYCVETGNVQNGSLTFGSPDTVIEVTDVAMTTLAINDDAPAEPKGRFLSRACWVQPASSGSVFTIVTSAVSNQPDALVSVRWIETTLFCPWFFVAGDYNAFSLIRNTTTSVLPGVVVTWRGLNGSVAGQTTVSIPANGTLVVNARDFVDPLAFSNGSIEIAHAGSPEALIGSTTTLSATTGLGFDADFEQRKAW
jgi:hypothetical protein